jgi:hypothetical protein
MNMKPSVLTPRLHTLAALVLAMLLTACATKPAIPDKTTAEAEAAERKREAPPPAKAPKRPAEVAVDKGVELYEQGDFAGAIKKLQGSPEIWADPQQDVKIRAYKYLAFSDCVTNKRSACQQQFEKILELDPGFELQPAEAGHPLWGPVFKRAKTHSASKRKQAN